MTERTVTIKVGTEGADQVARQLLEVKKRRDALLAKTDVKLNISGADAAQKMLEKNQAAQAAAMKDLGALNAALTAKTVGPMSQYQNFMSSAFKGIMAIGPGLVGTFGKVTTEFTRQKDLAQFWGVGGYINSGLHSLRGGLSGFLHGEGGGFTSWLQNASANLAQYRAALTVAAAAMVGMAAAAALSSKHSQNYIQATLDTRLMARKLTDRAGAEAWIQKAQGEDWSAGRESRMSIFQTVLSKNPNIGQNQGQQFTEDIEKYFYANQEMLQKKGIQTAEQLATSISAPKLMGDDATKFEDIFGLGFSQLSSTARLGRLRTEAKDIDINKAVQARPDEVLTKRLTATTQAMGDAVLPALNSVLGMFIKLSDIIGKIPGLGKAMGWAAVLAGIAASGLIVVSMIGSLIPGLLTVMGIMSKLSIVTKLAAAAQWVLNAAMTANPLGIVIMAIVGLVALLYALEAKFGIVTKAWKAFAGSTIGKGIIDYVLNLKKEITEMFGALGKAWKSGDIKSVISIGMEALSNSSPMFKLLSLLIDFIRKMWINSTTLNKYFVAAQTTWANIETFVSGLLSKVGNTIDWIKSGLGITRSEKKTAMEAEASKKGLKWIDTSTGQWFNGPGWYKKISDSTSEKVSDATLDKLKKEYEEAPKGIFEKMWEGIPGITDLTEAMSGLKTKIEDLVTWLKNWLGIKESTVSPDKVNAETGIGQQGSTTTGTGTAAGEGLQTPRQFYAVAPSKEFGKFDLLLGQDVVGTFATEAEANAAKPKMDRGGSINRTGSLIGHGGEEIDTAEVVAGGKTTLARITELFSNVSGSTGQQISIYAPFSVTIDKVQKEADIDKVIAKISTDGADKLLFALRNKLDNGQNRGTGYYQGA